MLPPLLCGKEIEKCKHCTFAVIELKTLPLVLGDNIFQGSLSRCNHTKGPSGNRNSDLPPPPECPLRLRSHTRQKNKCRAFKHTFPKRRGSNDNR